MVNERRIIVEHFRHKLILVEKQRGQNWSNFSYEKEHFDYLQDTLYNAKQPIFPQSVEVFAVSQVIHWFLYIVSDWCAKMRKKEIAITNMKF